MSTVPAPAAVARVISRLAVRKFRPACPAAQAQPPEQWRQCCDSRTAPPTSF